MSLKKVHDQQPKEFKFSNENLKKAEEILKKYPEKKIFLISATYQDAVEKIADHLKCFDGCYGTTNKNLKSKIIDKGSILIGQAWVQALQDVQAHISSFEI